MVALAVPEPSIAKIAVPAAMALAAGKVAVLTALSVPNCIRIRVSELIVTSALENVCTAPLIVSAPRLVTPRFVRATSASVRSLRLLAGDSPPPEGRGGKLQPGDSYSRIMDKVGVIPYSCTIHASTGMKATLTVTAA